MPIGHAQIFTLHHLIHHDGISQKQLTKYTKLDKGSIASQLHYLEKNGYITRKVSAEDARVLQINITEKTMEMKEELTEVFRNWSQSLMVAFDEDEKEKVYGYLCKIFQNAQIKIKDRKNEK